MDWTRRDFGRLAAGAAALGLLPRGASAQEVVRAHGVSAFGQLKYGAGFEMFDYATPEAPKGGTFSFGYGGITFDSLNPFILKGNPALGLTHGFDQLRSFTDCERQGLFAIHVEPRLTRKHCRLHMMMIGRRNDHRIEPGLVDHLPVIGVDRAAGGVILGKGP